MIGMVEMGARDCVDEGRVMMRDRGREDGTEREGSTDDFGRRKSAWEQERLVCRERGGASRFGRERLGLSVILLCVGSGFTSFLLGFRA